MVEEAAMGAAEADITISMINTNNRKIALESLESVFQNQGNLCIEVILVNNACTDGSTAAIAERFPQVKIIENERRLGFSTNNNLVLAQATGRYWMLLNDDTIVQAGALQAMVDFMDENPQAGAAGAALLNQDGSAQYCFGFPPHPLYDGLQPFTTYLIPRTKSESAPLKTGFVSGACLMARASAVKEIGLLDTRFDPLYSEEIDWCCRFRMAGWQVYHLPEAKVIHLGEVAARAISVERYERIFAKKAVYFRKHFGEAGAWVFKLALFLTNLATSAAWLAAWGLGREGAQNKFKVHWNMVRRALTF